MVTPFVPSPGSDRVTRSNPGAWLILRPGCGTWKPWGRLEAWRESGFTDALGYRFDLFHDDIPATNATTTVATSTISTKHGGKFTMDTATNVATPSITPQSSGDFGSGSRSGQDQGQNSGSGQQPYPHRNGSASGRERGGSEDAAAFVALAAAMDLSMDACLSFSGKLRKELRQQTHKFVV
ncbi:hypothetical protein GQ457_03G000900 [Hibiscus cannabinus]